MNIIGFDKITEWKNGLPNIQGITKATTIDGRTIILWSQNMDYNESSTHTLHSDFHMHGAGFVVDPVSRSHKKDISGNFDTQSITFTDGTVIPLENHHALMTFTITKPTMEEYKTLLVFNIALKNWNPTNYYDDNGKN